MPVKKLNPITPGTRFRVANTFAELTTDVPEKSLMEENMLQINEIIAEKDFLLLNRQNLIL